MNTFARTLAFSTLALLLSLCTQTAADADITDFTNWTVSEDPDDANLSGFATSSVATLTAGPGAVSPATDVAFSSFNGTTAADSTEGYYFDIGSDFEIAINFDLSFASAAGGLGFGFGIGEEVTGENTAGIGLATLNGSPILNFLGAARVDNVNQPLQDTGVAATSSGSLFVAYDSLSGDISVGASQVQDAIAPESVVIFSGIQNSWNDKRLGAVFFLRSDAIPILAPNGWTGGDATAAFTNFRVLSGTATAVPEPSSVLLLTSFCSIISIFHRKRLLAV